MKFSASVLAFLAVASQAAAVKESAGGENHPTFRGGLGHSLIPGQAGSHAKRAALAVADAIAEPRHFYFCSVPGSSCNFKREAEARRKFYFCSVPGSSCNFKREYVNKIGAATEKVYEALDAREREGELEARSARKSYFCSVPGSSCNFKREADAEPRRHSYFCSVPGSSCNFKREAEARHFFFCSVPGSSCNFKRSEEQPPAPEELDAAKRAVAAINAYDPQTLKDECFAPGGECDQILKAHKAFQEIKRAEEPLAKETSPAAKAAYCASHQCGPLATHHIKAAAEGHPEARAAEAACYGEDGACTLARRALDELESAINEGVASLSTM